MNTNNIPPDGGGPSQPTPTQELAPEQEAQHKAYMEMVQAAMMEELGVGRKDALPLEDRGNARPIPGPIRNAKPISRAAASADPHISAWRNFQPDDVDEADKLLDSIADGQLYRLRRGNLTGNTSRGGQSPGRGRGGTASRGGHSFTVNRGQPSRGGRGGGSTGRSVLPLSPTPKTFFNDGRNRQADREARIHHKIDAVIARLRAAPEDSPPKQHGANRRPADASVPQPLATSRAQQNVQLPAPKFALQLQEDAFLKFAGLSLNSPKPKSPEAQNLAVKAPTQSSSSATGQQFENEPAKFEPPSLTSKEAAPVATGPINIQLPAIKNEHEKQTFIPAATNVPETKETSTPAMTVPTKVFVKKEVGLAASRWADPTEVTRLSASGSAPPVSTFDDVYPRANVIREHGVRVQKDNGVASQGAARLIKNFRDDIFLTLELEQYNNVVAREVVNNDATLTLQESRVIFKAADKGVPCHAWTITFQLPYQALGFKTTIDKNNQGHPTVKPSTRHAPVSSRPHSQASSIRQGVEDAVSTTSFTPQPSAVINPEPVTTQLSEVGPPLEAKIGSESNFNEFGVTQHEWSDQFSHIFTCLNERLVSTAHTNEPADEQDFFGFSTQSPLVRNRISTQALDDMTQVAGVAPLISFDMEEAPVIKRETAVHNLLGLDDELLLKNTFEYLNNTPIGSLLSQLSVTVMKKGGPPATGLSGPELLASELYISAVNDLVGGYLSRSETFASMPDYLSIPYMKDKSRKTLEMAVAARDGPTTAAVAISTEATESPKSTSENSISWSETPFQNGQAQAKPISNNWDIALGNGLAKETEGLEQKDNINVGIKINRPSRITYSFKELMDLRKNAAEFPGDLDEEVAHLARPSPLESSTAPQVVNAKLDIELPRSASKFLRPSEVETVSVAVPKTAQTGINPAQTTVQPHVTQDASASNYSKNTQTQHTDMSQWLAMLSPDTKSAPVKAESLVVPHSVQSQAETAINPSKPNNLDMPAMAQGSKHFPRNSDYERLAKSLEGFHLEPENGAKLDASPPSPPIVVVQPSSSPQLPRDTPKSRLMEDIIVEKLTLPKLLLELSPVVSMSRSPLATVKTRLQAIEAHLDPAFKQTKIEEAPTQPLVDPKPLISTPVADMPKAEPAKPQPISNQHTGTTSTSNTVGGGDSKASPALPKLHPNLVPASNKDLKGIPGLGASKWSTPQFVATPNFRPFQPAGSYMYHQDPRALAPIPNSMASPPPILPNMPNIAPIFQTVLVQDESGGYREVTGMVKAGSIPTVAHVPFPLVTQENIGFDPTLTTQYSTPTSFQARSTMYSRHMSNESNSSDRFSKPDAPGFHPFLGRPEVAPANPGARRPLSPVRQGDNVQAKLQSRLNNSLAARISPEK